MAVNQFLQPVWQQGSKMLQQSVSIRVTTLPWNWVFLYPLFWAEQLEVKWPSCYGLEYHEWFSVKKHSLKGTKSLPDICQPKRRFIWIQKLMVDILMLYLE